MAEAARNIACSGAVPIGMTDCLNYGSPEKPEVFYMFERSVTGVADASAYLKIPVTGGNVSLYNESPQGAIDPTPIVGMIGLFEDVDLRVTQWFKKDGDLIYLLGNIGDSIGASRYLQLLHGKKTGLCPRLDLKTEKYLYHGLRTMAEWKVLESAHDCSDGGFAVAVAESCFTGATHEAGFRGAGRFAGNGKAGRETFWGSPVPGRYFLRSPERFSVGRYRAAFSNPDPEDRAGGGDALVIDSAIKVPVSQAADLFFTSIEKVMAS